MGEYIDPERIQKFENDKCALIFNDKLYHITEDEADEKTGDFNICSLHSQYSKVKLTAIDFSKGGGEKAIVVNFNLDPLRFKSIASNLKIFRPKAANPDAITNLNNEGDSSEPTEVMVGLGKYKNLTPTMAIQKDGEQAVEELERNMQIFKKNLQGKYGKMNQQKIQQIEKAIKNFKEKPEEEKNNEEKIEKKEEEIPQTVQFLNEMKKNPYKKFGNISFLKIFYNPQMRNPWNIQIEEGTGKINGAKVEGYKRTKKVSNIYITDGIFRDLIASVARYVEQKEAYFIQILHKDLEEYRRKYRKEKDESKKEKNKEKTKKESEGEKTTTENLSVKKLFLNEMKVVKEDGKIERILEKVKNEAEIEDIEFSFIAKNSKGKKIELKGRMKENEVEVESINLDVKE